MKYEIWNMKDVDMIRDNKLLSLERKNVVCNIKLYINLY